MGHTKTGRIWLVGHGSPTPVLRGWSSYLTTWNSEEGAMKDDEVLEEKRRGTHRGSGT